MDRHEYEINQLINPKKDIVKSNSKHRDNLETLIQGRRVGGIDGGGVPPTKRGRLIWIVWRGTEGFAGNLTPDGVFEIVHYESDGTDFVGSVDKTVGKVIGSAGPMNNDGFISFIISAAAAFGVEITKIIAGVVCEPQQDVPNWTEYEILN